MEHAEHCLLVTLRNFDFSGPRHMLQVVATMMRQDESLCQHLVSFWETKGEKGPEIIFPRHPEEPRDTKGYKTDRNHFGSGSFLCKN